jgi:hypothetical protein
MSRYGNDQMCGDQNEQDITTRPEGRGNMSTCFAWYLDTTKGTQSFKCESKDTKPLLGVVGSESKVSLTIR